MFSVYIRRAEEQGKAIFPNRFCLTNSESETADKDLKSLESLKQDKGPYEYGCQYLNDPVDDASIEFRRDWIRRYELNDETIALLKRAPCIMSVDPAFKLKETHDQTGIVITKNTEQGIFILDAMGIKVNAEDLINKIFELVAIYKPFKVKIETVAAQIILSDALRKEMLKRGESFVVDEYHPGTTQTKATRIRKLIPYYANGQILHRRGLLDLEEQLIQFPRGRRDDIIDALAAQVSDWYPTSKQQKKQTKEYTWSWWKKQLRPKHNSIEQLFADFKRRPF